jgi:hypothetical protein
MITGYNPSVSQEPRYQAIPIIPPRDREPLLSWLKRTGRLQSREIELLMDLDAKIPEELDDIIEAELYQEEE